jgi:hypothetical protein
MFAIFHAVRNLSCLKDRENIQVKIGANILGVLVGMPSDQFDL